MKKDYFLTPHARITFTAFFESVQGNVATFNYNNLTLSFPVVANAAQHIEKAVKGEPYLLILWFRTQQGKVTQPQLSSLLSSPPVKKKKLPLPRFVLGGKLTEKTSEQNSEQITLTFKIDPAGPLLQESFKIDVFATKNIVEKPSSKVFKGRTFIVSGEFNMKTGQLNAQKIKAKKLETAKRGESDQG